MLVVGLMILRRRWVVVQVVGNSMYPTLSSGQRIIVRRRRYSRCEVGDVIVFRTPEHLRSPPPWRVKRVVAVGGNQVPRFMEGAAYANSSVPQGFVVVRGDADQTEDSRHLGLIPLETIVAVIAGL